MFALYCYGTVAYKDFAWVVVTIATTFFYYFGITGTTLVWSRNIYLPRTFIYIKYVKQAFNIYKKRFYLNNK
jgi:hypothetical protein